MAKTEFIVGGVDLNEYKKQKEAVTQVAVKAVAERIEGIKKLLGEIKDIQQASDIPVDLEDLKWTLEDVYTVNDCNSSSAYC
jgi:predicted dienelactone hydrolase